MLSADSVSAGQARARERAIEAAVRNNWPIRQEFSDGTIMELQYLDANDRPIYYKTFNADASKSVGTDALYSGGPLGLSLDGSTLRIGIWDGGIPLLTHVEFQGRAALKDNATSVSTHATHVTGTILNAGINPAAKGMAPAARANIYDFNGDNGEMLAEAANGLLVSNHSYGEVLGWNFNSNNNSWTWLGDKSISSKEDYRFGLYTTASMALDQIAYQNPNYLIVKSAGNDRSDVGTGPQPGDGPYDCIGPSAVAKNILTVGAVHKLPNGTYNGPGSVQMTGFSSWGPTDDGRIKPDICGIGQNVFSNSSTGNNQYTTLSGTSMSAPNVSGSLLLLQELNFLLTAEYLSAAALKALIIHTANEAGAADGPDFQFGWGLLNTERAARQLLLNDGKNFSVIEGDLMDGENEDMTFTAIAGSRIVVTMAWTDVPGTAESSKLDPTTIKLVNDLDIRVTQPNAAVRSPFVLNPNTFQVSTGDNIRDNVEKIQFVAPESGEYKIRITHKNNLTNGHQRYALILSNSDHDTSLTTAYFTGDNNVLTDASSWALDKGGTLPLGRVPGPKDILIINTDDLPEGFSATMSTDLNCASLSILGAHALGINGNGHTILVENFVNLDNSAATISQSHIEFIGDGRNKFIQSTQENFSGIDLRMNAQFATLSIDGDLNVANLDVLNGNITSSNHTHKIGKITVSGASSSLSFHGDSITGVTLIDDETGSASWTMDDVSIQTATSSAEISFSGSVNGQIATNGPLVLAIDRVDELTINEDLTLASDIEIDDLTINEESTLTLTDDVTLAVGSVTIASGVAVTLQSPTKAFISGVSQNKSCIDNIVAVENIDVTGETKFVVPSSTSLVNASGWIASPCEDVLDADFTFMYPCRNGITYFFDASDGAPTEFIWTFKYGETEEVKSGQNQIFSFPTTGSVTVTLEVVEDEEHSKISKVINIINSTLGTPQVYFEDGKLKSTRFGDSYQWFLDDQPIPGATKSELVPTEEGEYAIEIGNSTCRNRSEPFLYVNVGVESFSLAEKLFDIFPNPVADRLLIRPRSDVRLVSVQLFDLLGRSLPLETVKGEIDTEIHMEGISAGTYLLLIRSTSGAHYHRILVTK